MKNGWLVAYDPHAPPGGCWPALRRCAASPPGFHHDHRQPPGQDGGLGRQAGARMRIEKPCTSSWVRPEQRKCFVCFFVVGCGMMISLLSVRLADLRHFTPRPALMGSSPARGKISGWRRRRDRSRCGSGRCPARWRRSGAASCSRPGRCCTARCRCGLAGAG